MAAVSFVRHDVGGIENMKSMEKARKGTSFHFSDAARAAAMAFVGAAILVPLARAADSYERDASVAAMQFMENRGMPGARKASSGSVLDLRGISKSAGAAALKDALVAGSRRTARANASSGIAVPTIGEPAAQQPKLSFKDRIRARIKARIEKSARYAGRKVGKAMTNSEQILGASVVGGGLGAAAGLAIGGAIGALVLGYLGSVVGAAIEGYRMGRR